MWQVGGKEEKGSNFRPVAATFYFLIQEREQQESNGSFLDTLPNSKKRVKHIQDVTSQVHQDFICQPNLTIYLYLGCLRSIRRRRRSLASSMLSGSLWEKLSSSSNRVQRFCSFIRSPALSCFPTETQCTPPGKQPGEEKNHKLKGFEQECFFERFYGQAANLLHSSISPHLQPFFIELFSLNPRNIEYTDKLKFGVKSAFYQ